jgi:hypothetical protein
MGAWSASLRAVVGAMVLSVGRADMLYAVGGEAGSQGATNSMERFNLDDPDARWELSIAMPSERLYHSVGVVNEEMYLVAGRGDKHDSHTGCSGTHCNLNTALRYDALLGEWDDMAPMHNARQYQGAAGDDEADLLYVAGGRSAEVSAEVMDTRSGTWANLPDLTRPRSGVAAVVVDSILWVIGGYDGNDVYLDSVEWFDIRNDEIRCRADPNCVEDVADWYAENGDGTHSGQEWTSETHASGTKDTTIDPSLVDGRRRQQATQGCDADTIGTGLTNIASACGGATVPTECSHQCAQVYTDFWAVCEATVRAQNPDIATLLSPLDDLCIDGLSAVDNGFDDDGWEHGEESGTQYVEQAAGCPPGHPNCDIREMTGDGGGNFQGVHQHACGGGDDDCEGDWHELDESMLSRRAYLCATVIDHDADGDQEIFVLGGKSHNNIALKSAEVFDIERRTWTAIPDMSTERWGHGCASHRGKIYAVGGKVAPPGRDYLTSMEVYDSSTRTWTSHRSQMSHRRAFFGIGLIHGTPSYGGS